jgi:hypothetical protein
VSRRDPDATDRDDAGESFLQRWSRLKSETRDAGHPVGPLDDTTPLSAREESQPEQPTPATPVAGVLPDLESLGPDSDYSAFLGPDVDVSLRRTALRKLFRSPKFNVLDGLDDYSDDFTQFAPLAGIVTADMRHHAERAARELMLADQASKPHPPTEDVIKPLLPDTSVDTAAARTQDDDAAAPGTNNGDTDRPATEESKQDAGRRPA